MGFDPLSMYIVSETSANAVTRVTSLVKTSTHRCCKVYIGQTHSAFETEFAFCQNHRLLQQSPRYQEPAQHLGCSMLQPFHGKHRQNHTLFNPPTCGHEGLSKFAHQNLNFHGRADCSSHQCSQAPSVLSSCPWPKFWATMRRLRNFGLKE